MIFLTSDWHFNHDQPFVWEARGFKSIDEMNAEIIKRHNSVVAPDDDVYVLGDLCMSGNLAENKNFIESLNGRIHVVLGNHCTANRQKMYEVCKNVVEICGYATMLKYKKYSFYLSHFPTNTGNYDDDDDRGLKGRIINLCGHLHSPNAYVDMEQGRVSYHVEMDAHDCYPISIEEIIITLKHYYNECDCDGNCAECKCQK